MDIVSLGCDFQVLIRQTYSNKRMGPRIISVIGYIDMDFIMATPRLPDVERVCKRKNPVPHPVAKVLMLQLRLSEAFTRKLIMAILRVTFTSNIFMKGKRTFRYA